MRFLWSTETKKPDRGWLLWSVRTTRKDALATLGGLGLGYQWRLRKWRGGALPVASGNTSDVYPVDKLGRRKRLGRDWS